MNMFKFDFKRKLKSLIYWSLGGTIFIGVCLALFPSMESSGMQELLNGKMDALPESMLQAFNISSLSDFSNLTDYSAYCLQYIALLCGAYASILGVNTVITEEGEGTIEFLYAKPVSRGEILWSKILTAITSLFIFTLIMWIVTILIGLIVKPDKVEVMDMVSDFSLMYGGMFLLGMIFLSIGVLLSTLLKHAKGATSISTGIFFGTYLIGMISKLSSKFEALQNLSPVDWTIPSKMIKDGIEGKYLVFSLVIIVVSLVVSNIVYKKKDLFIL